MHAFNEPFRVPLMELQAKLREKFGVPVNVSHSGPPIKQFHASRASTARMVAKIHHLQIRRADGSLPKLAVIDIEKKPTGKRNVVVTRHGESTTAFFPDEHYQGKNVVQTVLEALREAHEPRK